MATECDDLPGAARRALADPTSRVGFWSAVAAAVLAAVSFGLGVTTPPRSGPFAPPGSALPYPFTESVRFVPHDFLWMWPAMLMMVAFVVLVACVHLRADSRGRLFGLIGLCFAAISAAVILIDYFIQLRVVEPALLAGEASGVAALSQYNPHGVFIALEELGYLAMALAMILVAFMVAGRGGLERAIRWLLIAAGVLTLLAFAGLSAAFGFGIGYRFEVTAIAIDWIALAIAGVLLAFWFRRGPVGEPPAGARG